MQKCWDLQPTSRPKFSTIYGMIEVCFSSIIGASINGSSDHYLPLVA